MDQQSAEHGIWEYHAEVADETIKEYRSQMSLTEVVAQTKTSARVTAETDPRNVYSMAIMLNAKTKNLPGHLIFNFDTTTIFVTKNEEKVIVVKHGKQIPATRLAEDEIGIGIKYMHFHNAMVYAAPAVYIVANNTMKEGEFTCHIIPGLSGLNEQLLPGYVVFMPSRSCNKKFFEFFIDEIVVKFSNLQQSVVLQKVNHLFLCFYS